MSFEESYISELNILQLCPCYVLIFILQLSFRSIMIQYHVQMERLVSNDAGYAKSFLRKNPRTQMWLLVFRCK